MPAIRSVFLASLLPTIAACNSMYAPGPPAAEPITVRVFGDPDEPIEGAEIGSGAGTLAKTDATGTARFKLEGADGSRFDLGVTCPGSAGGGAARPLKIVLRRGSKAPEYTASCKRTVRSVVVAVKAIGVGGLPVMHLGRELARLDEAGMALVHLDMKVGDTFTLFLDTSEPKWAALRPQNPEISFQVVDGDELYNFEPKFHEEHAIVKRAKAAKPFVPKKIE